MYFSLLLIFSKKYQHRFIFEPLDDLSNNYNVTKHLLEGYPNEPKIIFFSGLHHNLMITSLRIFDDNKIFGLDPVVIEMNVKIIKLTDLVVTDIHIIIIFNYYLRLV